MFSQGGPLSPNCGEISPIWGQTPRIISKCHRLVAGRLLNLNPTFLRPISPSFLFPMHSISIISIHSPCKCAEKWKNVGSTFWAILWQNTSNLTHLLISHHCMTKMNWVECLVGVWMDGYGCHYFMPFWPRQFISYPPPPHSPIIFRPPLSNLNLDFCAKIGPYASPF